jgi:hypothetical protein
MMKHMRYYYGRKLSCKLSFSIIELVIFLIILSLFSMAWNHYSHATHGARLLGLISELGYYKKSVTNFIKIYNYFPGDFPHASFFWNNNCQIKELEDKKNICDGNGNYKVHDSNEGFIAWRHLLNASLLNGKNTEYAKIKKAKLGYTVPLSKFYESGGYQLLSDTRLNNINYYIGDTSSKLYIRFAGANNISDNLLKATMTAKDMFYIDTKFDDGRPLAGRLFADSGYGLAANSCINDSKQTYNILNKKTSCYYQYMIPIY